MKISGKCSTFGGPDDTGVSASEDLALYWEDSQVAEHPELFLSEQPPGTTGLARRLNPDSYYLAMRWSYEGYTKDELRDAIFLVFAPSTGRSALARAVDWGPHTDTDRVADLSPGLVAALGIQTDDEVDVIFPVTQLQEQPNTSAIKAVVISAGHGSLVPGASGFIEEHPEAKRVMEEVARVLDQRNVAVWTFADSTSTSQQQNLQRIVNFHNAKVRDLDVSIHFNANEETADPMGTECLYLSQEEFAADVSKAVSTKGGLKDRGAKKRTDLYFLNNTHMPAILVEVCFVDSEADVYAYEKNFQAICKAIADAIIGRQRERATGEQIS